MDFPLPPMMTGGTIPLFAPEPSTPRSRAASSAWRAEKWGVFQPLQPMKLDVSKSTHRIHGAGIYTNIKGVY